nr:hypothetical protein REQ54_04128 [Rhizobium sp. Q54]
MPNAQPSRRGVILYLLLITVLSMAFANVRATTLPMLQGPDEDTHLDYSLAIYSNGGLLRAAEAPSSGWHQPHVAAYYDWERISHIVTLHLTEAVDMHRIRVQESEKAPAGYGTPEFFERVDTTAPKAPANVAVGPEDNPWIMKGAPYGYYALVAAAMTVTGWFTDSVVALFFAGRYTSIALLGASIPLFYSILRLMGHGARLSLLVTAGFAFFPLIQHTAAAIQPDNLGLFAVLLSTFTALKIERSGTTFWKVSFAIAIGILAVTKYQFAVASLPPLLLFLWSRKRLDVLATILTMIPAVSTFGLHLWSIWGAGAALRDDVPRTTSFLISTGRAIWDYWIGGYSFQSFWSTSYAFRNIPILARWFLSIVTVAAVLAMLLYAIQLAARSLRMWRSSSPRLAGQELSAQPLYLQLILFSIFMVMLYAYTDNGFYAQGRHWLPFVPAMLAFVVLRVPDYLPTRFRHYAQLGVTYALLIFCFVGNLHSMSGMEARYYTQAPLPDLLRNSLF